MIFLVGQVLCPVRWNLGQNKPLYKRLSWISHMAVFSLTALVKGGRSDVFPDPPCLIRPWPRKIYQAIKHKPYGAIWLVQTCCRLSGPVGEPIGWWGLYACGAALDVVHFWSSTQLFSPAINSCSFAPSMILRMSTAWHSGHLVVVCLIYVLNLRKNL